jgi:hypothetical protein
MIGNRIRVEIATGCTLSSVVEVRVRNLDGFGVSARST